MRRAGGTFQLLLNGRIDKYEWKFDKIREDHLC